MGLRGLGAGLVLSEGKHIQGSGKPYEGDKGCIIEGYRVFTRTEVSLQGTLSGGYQGWPLAELEFSPVDLRSCIRNVSDFPAEGILFRDITPLLSDPAAFRYVADELCTHASRRDAAVIVGIESRGFLFGAPLADRMKLPFVPVRKPGKLPAAHISIEYALEYGESQLDIHEDAFRLATRAYIVDDLLATGGTAVAAAKLVELAGGEVVGFGFVVELNEFGGREKLGSYDALSLVQFPTQE